ncbi:MAG: transketolase [Planctomycetota bacterium]|nr:MAG: transketolase [Planctomycetota bacterium]
MERITDISQLKEIARQVRLDIIESTFAAGSGHPGGSMSAVEVIVALYYREMNYRPQEPHWPDRDRFILSKGHACPAQYAVLARVGFFPHEELKDLRKLGSILQGHPDMLKTPGLDASTGSLGMGLSYGNGVALAGGIDRKDYRVYVMLGDGEMQEGEIWESAMTAAHRKLDNLCAILDYNKLQIDGFNEDVKGIEPIADKWRSFNWHVVEIDGHDFRQIFDALDEARRTKGKPTIIVSHTIKGRGVSFMEKVAGFHGRCLKPDEMETAREELREPLP